MLYKVVMNGCIIEIGTGKGKNQITEAEYNDILSKIRECPGDGYELKDKSKEWEVSAVVEG